ncbi:MAG: TlpA disulfide reductase family protein [Pyrinomonadaceae bacterium]
MIWSRTYLAKAALCAVFAVSLCGDGLSQHRRPRQAGPKVTRIGLEGLRSVIKPKGKPLLINFWATWCEPCREEFPDIVRLHGTYKTKIDVITVSLDDLADIRIAVPKFLAEMKATMPAYLLKTPDESAAVSLVSKDWPGNLPMTILYSPTGETVFLKNKKVTYQELSIEIDKLIAPGR